MDSPEQERDNRTKGAAKLRIVGGRSESGNQTPETAPPHRWMLFVFEDLHRYAAAHALEKTADVLQRAIESCEHELLGLGDDKG